MADFDFTLDDLKSNTPAPFVAQQTKHQETPSPLETSRSRYNAGQDMTEAVTEPSTLSMGQILMNVPLYRDTTDSVSDNEYLQSQYLASAMAGSNKVKTQPGSTDTGQGLGGFNLLVPQDVLGTAQQMAAANQKAGETPGQGGGAAGGAAGGGAQATGTALDLINFAKTLLGKPYVYGAKGPNSFDCSGFTFFCYQHVGLNIGGDTSAQAASPLARPVAGEAQAMPGDLVFFGSLTAGGVNAHVGMYLGNDQMIDAPNSRSVVRYDAVSSWGRSEPIVGWRRYLPDQPASGGSGTSVGAGSSKLQ